jgi:hypothetical protein
MVGVDSLRFTRSQIEVMLNRAGFANISFSNCDPFCRAVGLERHA